MFFFKDKIITDKKGEERRITEEEATKLYLILFKHDVIDEDGKITSEGRELIEKQSLILPENLDSFRDSVCSLLKSIYTGNEFIPEDERKSISLKTNKNFKKKEFQALWDKINVKTIYEVQFDTQQLIDDSVIIIDSQLNIGDRSYEVKTGELKDGTAEQMKEGSLLDVSKSKHLKLNDDLYSNTVYDIIGEMKNNIQLFKIESCFRCFTCLTDFVFVFCSNKTSFSIPIKVDSLTTFF